MDDNGDAEGNDVSIGQQNQLRDREMLREERKRQDEDAGGPAERLQHEPPLAKEPHEEDRAEEWHPGQAEQPDRDKSGGLTGTGPVQY